jgi:riboflavin kinase/FMN adenylyltransferase
VLHGEPRLRLDLPEEKLELLDPLGIRQLVLVPFDRALAALSPEAFVAEVLVGQLRARQVAVGADFCFGAGRSGTTSTLRQLGDAHGLQVDVVPMLADGCGSFSSSRIRRALAAGRIDEARDLLERPYRFRGVVHSGRGLGRKLGWPTANLQIDGRKFLPREGVYAAWAWWPGGEPMAAVMNLAQSFAGSSHERTLRFVFFGNGAVPWAGTAASGSVVYATDCAKRGEQVVAMVELGQLGVFPAKDLAAPLGGGEFKKL